MSMTVTIPIISDAHGYGRRAETILERLERIGECPRELIFLGDGTRELLQRLSQELCVYAVRGNCDGFSSFDILDSRGEAIPSERLEIIGGKRLLMMHGHEYSVKSGLALAVNRAVSLEADALLFGHTHMPVCEILPKGSVVGGRSLDKALHVFNPGALIEGSFGILTVRDRELILSHGRV